MYIKVSENLVYTFTLDVFKTGHCTSERILCSTSVKDAVKILCKSAFLPFILPKGLREVIHLFHSLFNNK